MLENFCLILAKNWQCMINPRPAIKSFIPQDGAGSDILGCRPWQSSVAGL